MIDNNNIEKTFKDAFENFEAPVDASLWQGIEQVVSQPAVSSVAAHTAAKSFSVTKLIVAATAISAIGITSYFFITSKSQKTPIPVSVEIHSNPIENKGSVSETVTQPTPEKIVSNEVPSVSSAKKQSSPDVFSVSDDKPAEKLSNSISGIFSPKEETIAPKPVEITPNKALAKVEKPQQLEKEKTVTPTEPKTVIENADNKTKDEPLSLKETIYTFPGQETQSFSPNGDGKNDYYKVDGSQMADISVKIISSSGKKVYLRDLPQDISWDGKLLNGEEAPEGLYIVFINGTGLDGKKYSRITRLMLVRN